MVRLDELRVAKLKCLSCGSRDKRVSILSVSEKNGNIGFATTCCNCGHTKRYVFRHRKTGNPIDNRALKCMLEGRYFVSSMFCPIPRRFCRRKNCDLYKKRVIKDDLCFKDIQDNNYTISNVSRTEVDTIERKPIDRDINERRFR